MKKILIFSIIFVFISRLTFADSRGKVITPAWSEKRTALIIGNSAYTTTPLKNPTHDATDIAAQLRKLGFSVALHTDLNRKAMRRAIRQFSRDLQTDRGVGLFYFAGHGMQVNGVNYLIPVDTDIEEEYEMQDEAINASSVLRSMETAGNRMNMVFLDACRNNPFARSFRAATRGLAEMQAPTGSVIVYATALGGVADDGSGRNGVFTKHLLQQMQIPGLEFSQLIKDVREGVLNETRKRQVPWSSSSLIGQFYFVQPKKQAKSVVPSESATTQSGNEPMRWGQVWGIWQ